MCRMFILSLIISMSFVATTMSAEDLALGVVTATDGKQSLTVAFNADHNLLPDDMLAIYGPGKVEKHPLTNQVVTEQRQLVAKAHILQVTHSTLQARVTWIADGIRLAQGFDALPLPGEASPDAPPILYAEVKSITVEAQKTVTISIPVIDPEEGALGIVWSLEGKSGHVGRLSAQVSGIPEIQWTTPGAASSGFIVAVVTDSVGQKLEVKVPFTVNAPGDNYRQRALKTFASFGDGKGGSGAGFKVLEQNARGDFLAISADGRSLYQMNTWNNARLLEVAADAGMRAPRAVAAYNKLIYVLDSGLRRVLILNTAGQLQRQFATLKAPSDLAIADDGTVFIADQLSGGVQVYEKDGSFRATLGRTGTGIDSFTELSRVCLDARGVCYALDVSQRMVQRFDTFHRRLPTWTIEGDAAVTLVDIAVHPLGLLILLSDGRVLIHTDKGLSGTALPSVAQSGLVNRLTLPSSISVDRTNRIYVTYPREKIMVRYGSRGQFAGVRGPGMWSYTTVAADAKGWMYGLDARSGFIYAHDDEGWRMYRLGGLERAGGPFLQADKLAVAWDGSALVVSDKKKLALYRYTLGNGNDKPSAVFGQKGKNNGQFLSISALCMDDAGVTYVADERNHKVSLFNSEGGFMYNFGSYSRGKTAAELVRPQFIAVNAAGTECYIYDAKKYEFQKFTLNAKDGMAQHVTNQGGRGKALGQVSRPIGMSCDRFGLLYVVDSGRKDIQVLDFRGNNMVGILSVNLPKRGLSAVSMFALNPDGIPYVGSRGQVLGLRWSKHQ